MKFWLEKYAIDAADAAYSQNLNLSNAVLPCHTFAYDSLKPIFGYDGAQKKFIAKNAKFLSQKSRLTLSGKKDYDEIPQHMEESVAHGHDVFLFAYHGVHNPYHRLRDERPVRPFGVFLKTEIENFACVHGSPWDITQKNNFAIKDITEGNLDKYYLLAEDLRKLKPVQIQQISYLKNDFWRYFGNPYDWAQKGYGGRLFETAGEIRYYNEILPATIAAVLWPMWYSDSDLVDENLDLQASFKMAFPSIDVVNYTSDKYENFVLSLVEASYYTQRYYLDKKTFPSNAEIAILKMKR